MGQPNYCCASGQSCAWDDAGNVACCASGTTCQGSAYSSGAAAGQYYDSSTAQRQTETVYQSLSENCNCESSTAYGVVPVVPVTVTTVLPPPTTSYYNPATSTYYPPTTTTTTAAEANAACAGGYTTITEAHGM